MARPVLSWRRTGGRPIDKPDEFFLKSRLTLSQPVQLWGQANPPGSNTP